MQIDYLLLDNYAGVICHLSRGLTRIQVDEVPPEAWANRLVVRDSSINIKRLRSSKNRNSDNQYVLKANHSRMGIVINENFKADKPPYINDLMLSSNVIVKHKKQTS